MKPSDAVAQATSLVGHARDMTKTPWEQIAGTEAIALAEAVTTARSLLDASLLRIAERLEATEAPRELGWATVKDYLTHLTGGHKGTGGGLVRTAAQLHDLPAVQAALEDGAITLPQARAIAAGVHKLPRQAPQFREEVAQALLDAVVAEGHDASALQGRTFDTIVRRLDPDGLIIATDQQREKSERGAHQARFLSFSEDRLGGVRVKGYGTREDAERIKTALFPLTAPTTTAPGACGGRARRSGEPMYNADGTPAGIPCPDPGCRHDGTDPREHGTRLWDALVEACDRLRATESLPRDHGTTPRVIVTIDHDSLTRQLIDAGLAHPGHTTTGATLSAAAVRRLACDAEVLPTVLGTASQPLDVGRSHRLVTPAIWNALLIRDQHCAFPGCTRMPLACDAHHIQHWADGGPTSLDNLVLLCRRHHTLTHHSPWTVHIDPHTRRPLWQPPPRQTLTDLKDRITYYPARAPDTAA
ncbi:HNH endonuclease signature motif containing protein [Nocardioides daejeonensis]|uniref:HNH endonuclease signature motif containing protein n=1 Tax=Nocardioides daejeonensis TaxID=1046556 RepID=UPI0013A5449A|nr:HNH endonuclease signature motif containing protein [Nocardioides daejeonensis]